MKKSQVEEYRQHVRNQIANDLSETISSLTQHHKELLGLSSQLTDAKSQIVDSSTETKSKINKVFDDLLNITIKEIDERKTSLLSKVEKTEEEALEPLTKCEALIQSRLKEAKSRLDQGACLQRGTVAVSKDTINRFQEDSASMTMLPQVPPLCIVPCISIQFPENPSVEEDFVDQIRNCGTLCKIGPVQITTIEEKPGAVLVNWEEVEDDDDISHEFRLECSSSLCPNERNPPFHKVYEGKDFNFIVRDLRFREEYLLRVASKQEGSALWSPWSLPVITSTPVLPFCWKEMESNEGFWSLADGSRLATKCTEDSVFLYSNGAQVYPGSSVLVEIISCYTACSDEGIGLCWDYLTHGSPIQPGTFFLNVDGNISQDGVTRLTKLPSMKNGAKVIFSSERISHSKVRIAVEIRDKEVAYDWIIPANGAGNLYFFANFSNPGWKISVH